MSKKVKLMIAAIIVVLACVAVVVIANKINDDKGITETHTIIVDENGSGSSSYGKHTIEP